jgi:hypothetical protein
MAEYIKFRLTAAKVGVSMAFLALLAGVADKARAATPSGIPGVSTVIKLDRAFLKIDNALLKLEHKLASSYFTAHKIDGTFLKIKSADSNFLKITTASANYLKIDDANSQFLKLDDASLKYLKIDGTAANASELGGLPAGSFVQGQGSVATGALTINGNSPQQTLLQVPGTNGEIIVVCTPAPAGGNGAVVTFHNGTGVTIPAVIHEGDNADNSVDLPPGDTTLTTMTGADQVHVQTFPATGFNQVLTLTVSGEPAGNGFGVVGQMLNGSG